ncbi:MAG: DUF748 domain-containing protein [Deltaproteobacteria bacterium]|nr:DUF748 domain-containing protein [Deltaproteobacteria bacterium]
MSYKKKIASIIVGIVAVYAVVGFLVVPPIVKSKLERIISDTLGVTATVRDVAVNPFALSATVRGFAMESGGKPLARFEELYVNFQLSSLFHRAYTFSVIRLTSPEGLVEIMPGGSLNWVSLIPATKDQSSDIPSKNEIAPLLIHQLEIEKGRINFADLSQAAPFEAHLSPIDVLLEDFSTKKDRDGRFHIAATLGKGGDVEWKGSMSVNPVRSQGTFEVRRVMLRPLWEYIRDRFNFEVTGGSMDVAAQYAFDAGTDSLQYELKGGSIAIRDFALCEKGMAETLISIPIMTFQNTELRSNTKELSIASITSANARIAGWRNRDGTINYEELFAGPPGPNEKQPVSDSENGTGKKQQGWTVGIESLSLDNYGIALEDRMPDSPVRVFLEPVTLSMNNLTNRPDVRSDISLRLTVNRTGTAELKGTASVNPPTADVAVSLSRIALKDFRPYVAPFAKVDLVDGTAGIGGVVNYGGKKDGVPSIRYRGNAHVNGLHVDDMLRQEDLLKWKSLALSGMDIAVAPTRISIANIVFTEPYARVIIFPDGTVNLGHVFAKKESLEEKAATSPPPAAATTEIPDGAVPVPITVGTVRIAGGSANFADFSLKPAFATGIQDLNGTVKGLSSNPSARADVSLTGAVDRYAPVIIKGKINPLSPTKFADVEFSFKNMELTSMTPYSGKFAGYAIEKGKLSLDLDYLLEGNRLIGENKIFLNQFTLGERVESASATSLPVSLAIALLKDRQGNITIDLPVQGDIDDREFSYGRLVIRALVNLITKIVTAPFAALGSLLGGQGEELSHIDFEYGSAVLAPEQTEKLDRLAKALYERPSLRLEIRGIADRISDRSVLADKAVMRTIRELKADELRAGSKKVPPTIDEIALSGEDYARLVTKAYRKLRERKPELPPPAKKITGEALQMMKRELTDAITIEDSDLRQLAHERARQIKGCLLGSGSIENERLFILDVRIDDTPENDRAQAALSLS